VLPDELEEVGFLARVRPVRSDHEDAHV
jgi:hypothetical protein